MKLLAPATLLAFSTTLHLSAAELKPLNGTEEWTYQQQRVEPGRPVQSNQVRFSSAFKKKNGDTVLFWARAITDAGQVVWQPLQTIPAASCVQDFLGKTDLGLPYVCADGLRPGDTWASTIQATPATEQISFVTGGEETLTTPAGTFQTLKIEGKGKRTSPGKPAEDLRVTYWFAPEAKAMVRTVREYRSLKGAPIMTLTDELTAVKLD